MYCTKCGKQISEEARFCSFCGQKIEVQQESSGTGSVENIKRDSRDKTTAIAFSLVFIMLIVIGIFGNFGSSSKKLVGTWVCENEVSGYPDGMVLYEDGTAICDGSDCTWRIEDQRIYFEDISIFISDKDYRFDLKGKKLYLDGFLYTKSN